MNQIDRDLKWRKVSYDLKLSFVLSGALVVLSEIASRFDFVVGEFHSTMSHGEIRAWVYIFGMYLISFPILVWRIFSDLSGYEVPTHPISTRILVTVLALAMCPLLIFGVFVLMALGGTTVSRSGAVYDVFIGSLLGLFVEGAFFYYVSVISFWMLFVGIPKVWLQSTKKS